MGIEKKRVDKSDRNNKERMNHFGGGADDGGGGEAMAITANFETESLFSFSSVESGVNDDQKPTVNNNNNSRLSYLTVLSELLASRKALTYLFLFSYFKLNRNKIKSLSRH